jgi:hypothetical protein
MSAIFDALLCCSHEAQSHLTRGLLHLPRLCRATLAWPPARSSLGSVDARMNDDNFVFWRTRPVRLLLGYIDTTPLRLVLSETALFDFSLSLSRYLSTQFGDCRSLNIPPPTRYSSQSAARPCRCGCTIRAFQHSTISVY